MSTGVHELRIADIAARYRITMHRHVFESPDHEVGGVLVGRIDGRTGQPRVTGVIPALEAVGERASVTFTHEAWELILERQEEEFPNTQIVGWYHSHPGFGIFLSGADLFIHQNFFSDRHQFAYVVDPIERSEGIFGWRDGEIAMFERIVGFPTDHLAGIELPAAAAPSAAGLAAAEAFELGELDTSAPPAGTASPGKLTIGLDDLADDVPAADGSAPGLVVGDDAVAAPTAAGVAPGVGAPGAPRGPVDPRAERARAAARRRRAVLAAAASVVLLGGIGVVVATGSGGGGSVDAVNVGDNGATADGDKNAKSFKEKADNEQEDAEAAFSEKLDDTKAQWKADHAAPPGDPKPTPSPSPSPGPNPTPAPSPTPAPAPSPSPAPTPAPKPKQNKDEGLGG